MRYVDSRWILWFNAAKNRRLVNIKGLLMRVEEALRGIPFFQDLPLESLTMLGEAVRLRHFSKGSHLFYEGDPGDTLFIVLSGRVKTVVESEEGRELTVNVLNPGDFVGELSILDGEPRSATGTALEDTEALSLPGATVRELLAQNPQAAMKVIEILTHKLRRTTELSGDLTFLDVESRVAKKLQELFLVYGSDNPIPLTQEELARMVGSTREKVNRVLSSLSRSGHVSLGHQNFKILKPWVIANLQSSRELGEEFRKLAR